MFGWQALSLGCGPPQKPGRTAWSPEECPQPPPKDVHVLVPRTWERVTSHGKEDLTDVLRSGTWRGGATGAVQVASVSESLAGESLAQPWVEGDAAGDQMLGLKVEEETTGAEHGHL